MSRAISILLIFAAGVVLIVFGIVVWRRNASPLAQPTFSPEIDQDDQVKIMSTARKIYDDAKATGQNFDNGPCLGVIPGYADWVVDIAHNPRLPIDDNPANQCNAFRTGQTKHFIEFDPKGQVIKIF